ncbi:MAG: DUF4174 domain-containing protein [Cyclobacteriaceae bacterium]
MGKKADAQSFLEPYKWKKRVIILVADDANHPKYRRQLELLKESSPGIRERDLIILSNQSDSLSSEIRDEIPQRFGTSDGGYRFILIGKDGTVKKDSSEVVPMKELFATIDAMPMRRREMRDSDH